MTLLSTDTQKRAAFVYDATTSYFEGELSSEEIEQIVSRLSDTPSVLGNGRSCLVFGYGSQSHWTYQHLAELDGVSIVWQGACGPWWMAPLSLVVAMHSGLVEVLDRTAVRSVLEALAHQAMVEMYSFSTELKGAVRSDVSQRKGRSRIGELIGCDPGYFCFGVDGDNFDVESGIFGWCSFGRECPESLRHAVVAGHTTPQTGT